MLKEFKPSIVFLGKFLGVYLAGNLLYGLWIMSFEQKPDSFTRFVTEQTSFVISVCYENTTIDVNAKPKVVSIKKSGNTVLNVYEGCNGLNVMIVFAAFVVAFGGRGKTMLWFIPSGLVIIHFFNLMRISLLYLVAQHYQHYFYYIHKYVFTAALYVIVFVLWIIWVVKINDTRIKTSKN